MTTIVYDGEYVYADSQTTAGDVKYKQDKIRKVSTPEGNVVVAVSGEYHMLDVVCSALEAGQDITKLVKGNVCVMVANKKQATLYSDKRSWNEKPPVWMGSGAAAARGAFAICEDAAMSVKAACGIDLYSCLPVKRIKV